MTALPLLSWSRGAAAASAARALLFSVPLLFPPAAAAQNAPDDTAGVRTVIESVNAGVERWIAAGHADSLASAFAEDARQMGPNAEPSVGREAIVGFWRDALGWGRWDFDLRTEEVHVSGPLAIERGSYTIRFEPGPAAPPGMPAFTDEGSYLVHWERRGDSWLIVNDIATSRLPRNDPA